MPPIPTARAAAARLIPFSLPQLHIGTDICHVTRVYAILAKPARSSSSSSPRKQTANNAPQQTTAARFVRRVLTPREIDALGPAPSPLVDSPHPPTMSAHAAVAWLARGHALPSSLPASKPDALPDAYSPLWRAAQYLAGRFAAKEAAIKAHPHLRELTLQDVRIARRGIGEGQVESEGEGETDAGAQEHLARKGTGPPLAFVRVPSAPISEGNDEYVEQEARISISHDGEYATAVCLGVEHAS